VICARIKLFLVRNKRPEVELFGHTLIPKGKLLPSPLLKPRNIADFLEQRLQPIVARPDVRSREQVFRQLIDAIRGVSERTVARTEIDEATGMLKIKNVLQRTPESPLSRRWLVDLAGIEDGDSQAMVELKLRDLMFFLRAATLDTDVIHEMLESIDDFDLSLAAFELATPR
jgi:hypothetical protein